jgi:hypothetical protein
VRHESPRFACDAEPLDVRFDLVGRSSPTTNTRARRGPPNAVT